MTNRLIIVNTIKWCPRPRNSNTLDPVKRLNDIDIALLNKSLAICDHSVTYHPTQVNTP